MKLMLWLKRWYWYHFKPLKYLSLAKMTVHVECQDEPMAADVVIGC